MRETKKDKTQGQRATGGNTEFGAEECVSGADELHTRSSGPGRKARAPRLPNLPRTRILLTKIKRVKSPF